MSEIKRIKERLEEYIRNCEGNIRRSQTEIDSEKWEIEENRKRIVEHQETLEKLKNVE